MYTTTNFKTKAELKRAVAAGEKVTVYNPGLSHGFDQDNGRAFVEGPHYPQPHKWYAEVTLQHGIVVKVK